MLRATRNIAWLLCLLLLFVSAGAYGQVTENFDSAGTTRAWLAAAMGALGLASVILFPRFPSKKLTLLAIFIPALLVRLFVAQAAPSDDIHRYLWEGKLLAAGEDPYAVLADDPSREPYRDFHWQHMNHRDQPTAYPPMAMLTFSYINTLGYSPTSYKLVFTLLDLALIACLLALLYHYGKPLKWAAFYALSPIAFLSFSAEAHFDILMVVSLVSGVLAHSKRRYILAGIALAFAIHFKLMVAVAIPFLLWRSPVRMWIAFGLALLLPLLPFVDQLINMFQAVLHFGSVGSFNGPVYQLLQWLIPVADSVDLHRETINRFVAIFYVLTWCAVSYLFLRKRLTPLAASVTALATLLIFSPIVHFWYLAWILPFIALSPRASWLSLSISFGLYFLVWQQLEVAETWVLPVYARWLFWLPFFLIGCWQCLGKRCLFDTSVRENLGDQTPSFSIVIPTKNAGTGLSKALQSIHSQSLAPDEILIVDAGSKDGSLENLDGCRVLKSKAGRGLQIKTGVEAAKSQWALILHADAQLPNNALQQLSQHITTNPDLVGGCFGQRFDSTGSGLLLVEVLNELRGLFARTSFGDQAQFLHRPTALAHNVLTDQPLMEDVEISDRLRPLGQVSYLGNEVTVSAEKWRKYPFWQRFRLIVRYFFRYRLMLWKSPDQRKLLADELVQEYYSAAHK